MAGDDIGEGIEIHPLVWQLHRTDGRYHLREYRINAAEMVLCCTELCYLSALLRFPPLVLRHPDGLAASGRLPPTERLV